MKPEVPSIYGHFIDNEQVTERKKNFIASLLPQSESIRPNPSQSKSIQVNPS